MTKAKRNDRKPKTPSADRNLDPLSPNNQRPPGTRSGSQYNADANTNPSGSNPNPSTEVPNSNQSSHSNNGRSTDAPEEQMSTRSRASNRSSRSNRSRASNHSSNSHASQPVPSSASQKSNNSQASTANKSQRQPARDPDGINADDLVVVAPPQPPGSRSHRILSRIHPTRGINLWYLISPPVSKTKALHLHPTSIPTVMFRIYPPA